MNNPLAGTDPTGYSGCAASHIQRVCDNTPSQWGGNGQNDEDRLRDQSARAKENSSENQQRQGPSDATDINAQSELAKSHAKNKWRTLNDLKAYAGFDSHSEKDSIERITVTGKWLEEDSQDSGAGAFAIAPGIFLLGNYIFRIPLPHTKFLGGALMVSAGIYMAANGHGEKMLAAMRGESQSTNPTPGKGPEDGDEEGGFKNDKEAEEYAIKKLGFKKTSYRSHGQKVFRKGKKFITRDVDGHNGGAWKMADSVKNLGSKNTIMGTYSRKLNKIGK